MDALNCTQLWFQWDDEHNCCAGCMDNGSVAEDCEDYIENVKRAGR